jgi:hypothetical protein
MWGLENNWYIKSVRLNGEEVLDKELQIEKTSNGKLDVVLSSASSQLEGSVSGPDGPVVGARVFLSPEPSTPYNKMRSQRSSTDQSGHFSFAGVPPGAYRVRAKCRSAARELRSEPKDISLSELDHKSLQLTLVTPPAE